MTSRPKRDYLLPVASTLIVLVGIVLLVAAEIDFTPLQVMLVVLIYFMANIVYGLSNKELTVAKVVEYGLVAALIGYIALSYLV